MGWEKKSKKLGFAFDEFKKRVLLKQFNFCLSYTVKGKLKKANQQTNNCQKIFTSKFSVSTSVSDTMF